MQGCLQYLAQRGMRMDNVLAFVYRNIQTYQGAGFLYQIGGMGTVEVTAQQAAVFV